MLAGVLAKPDETLTALQPSLTLCAGQRPGSSFFGIGWNGARPTRGYGQGSCLPVRGSGLRFLPTKSVLSWLGGRTRFYAESSSTYAYSYETRPHVAQGSRESFVLR